MLIKLHYITLIIVLLNFQGSFLRGLKFNGGEVPIAERTSYNVFDDSNIAFSDSFDIDFDLSLYPPTLIGYIIRIKNTESDKIFNLFYDGQGPDLVFRFNQEGKSSLIIARMSKEYLLNTYWFNMKISFDLKNDSISLKINDQTFSAANVGLPQKYHPVILFGKSDYIIDVPSFAIKELTIGNKDKYHFDLNENEGSIVHDIKGKSIGNVSNPEWLINDAYHWRHKISFQSGSVAGANYNPQKKEIYYFNRDTIHKYNVRTEKTEVIAFNEPCPVNLFLGTNFLDPVNNKLYSYEVFFERENDIPTVASLELSTHNWTAETTQELPIQLHHHGSFFDPENRQYTIFGGFGNMFYNNDFFSYSLENKEWQTLAGFTGDFLSPRYFSSVGYLKKTNSAYIFGGMGNESGEQIVGRKYYYDLYKVDLNTKNITKLWEIPWVGDNVVPVRGMVILNDSCFYTFCYPEHYSESSLRLYRFSLADGSYEILGDSVPIRSDKITTNANLYFDEGLHTLYALIQEFDDDIASELKIYSLAFPPITAEELVNYSKPNNSGTARLIIILLPIIVVITFIFYRRIKLKYSSERNGSGGLSKLRNKRKVIVKPNSIYLFGDFAAHDRNNKDITYMFSTRLKQMLILLLQHSAEKDGISSQKLGSILWPGKPAQKVKNLRGVTINHLRKALSEFEGVELVYEKGCFKLVLSDEFYCDYTRCLDLISGKEPGENQLELLELLGRGKFLKLADDSVYDPFKQEAENKLEPALLLEMENAYNAEAYQLSIEFSEVIFNIDPLNEVALTFQVKALQKLKLNEEAQLRYNTYTLEYKMAMGSSYTNPNKILI
ncbi:Kelch repeat-containing protein [Draconibacterium mangrovi]|uniref:Kelch repeat-containing protein n=1 Tax=Draconibacterium mangrovi TaxID=2697469 RepID=UPI0013CFE5FE|nr:kelch repeat-containing protein [Draconibacterium mangrovi]